MNICVFSSSSNAIAKIYFEEGRNLGRLIGQQGHALINGGANVGLMETVTIEARRYGAKTIGVIPERFADRALASKNSEVIITTRDMMDRKAKMRELSDAFIALPGGFGTIEEIMEVITLRQLNYHNKPIVFINTNNFFEHLFNQFEASFTQNFAKNIYRALYFNAKHTEEAMEFITVYKPVDLDPKWFMVPYK